MRQANIRVLREKLQAVGHDPYGKTADYIKYVQEADNLKLAKLIKILAMLAQAKIYLVWAKQEISKYHSH